MLQPWTQNFKCNLTHHSPKGEHVSVHHTLGAQVHTHSTTNTKGALWPNNN